MTLDGRNGASHSVPSPVAPEARPQTVGEGQGGEDCRTQKVCTLPTANPSPQGGGVSAQRLSEARRLNRAEVSVIIPCLDEETAIGTCVAAVRAHGVGEVIVVDGGSRDSTIARASDAGARVIVEQRRGYGRAMLAGIAALSSSASVVLFIDGDGSDRPEMIPAVLAPIEDGTADFVLGSRLNGPREPGSLAPAQILAGHLAGWLIRLRYGVRFTDLSPFRAIRRDALERLGMREETFGWNLEMQMRAAAAGLHILEVPVGQRCRAGGTSKVSGDLATAARAAWVLVRTFLRLAPLTRTASRHQRSNHNRGLHA